MFDYIVSIIMFGVGVYAIYAGITKKGVFFEKVNLAKDDDLAMDYVKMLSIFLITVGSLTCITIVLEFFVIPIIVFILYSVIFLIIIYFYLATKKMFPKEKISDWLNIFKDKKK